MGTIRLRIDSKEVITHKGATLLEAAQSAGIHIPTLCFYKRLHPIGSCRMCLVEIDGYAMPVTACTTPVMEGISVTTNSKRLFTLRQETLRLILNNYQLTCSACDKGGDCLLEDLATEYNITSHEYNIPRQKYTSAYQTPFIRHDPTRCILCLRCIHACTEIQGIGALSLKKTEHGMQIAFDRDKCVSCGECVQACPAGGMMEKKATYHWQSREITETVRTTCPYCGVGCQQLLHVNNNGKIVKVTGVEDGAPNKGRLCVKGRYGFDFIYSKERLTQPLLRNESGFREVSWDEALDYVAQNFSDIIHKYGPDAVAGVSCARSISEDSYQMQKLFRSVFKTNNIDHCART